MRIFRVLGSATFALTWLLLHSLSAMAADQDYWENGWDRPGNDYRPPIELEFKTNSFLTFQAECQGLCEQDKRCKAWTMVKPGVQGPKARCYLKDPAPAQRKNNCCVSGIAKRARPQLSPEEVADRDPTGKSIAQCEQSFARNLQRCQRFAGSITMKIGCEQEMQQIRAACVGIAAATQGGGTTGGGDTGGGEKPSV